MTYSKSIQPFSRFLTPTFIQQKYPLFADFIKVLLKYIDTQNDTGWFDTDAEKKANSIYKNIANFTKFGNIDDIPVKNKEILLSYYINWATIFSFNSYRVKLQDDEYLRQFIKYSNVLYRTKGTYKAFDMFINLIQKVIIGGVDEDIFMMAKLIGHFDVDQAPDFYSTFTMDSTVGYIEGETIEGTGSGATGQIKYIVDSTTMLVKHLSGTFSAPEAIDGDESATSHNLTAITEGIDGNIIVLSEIPTYFFNTTTNTVDREDRFEADKGKYPYHYQIASHNPIMNDQNFINTIFNNLHPAGFQLDIFKEDDFIVINIDYTCKPFTAYYIEVSNSNIV